MINDEIFPVSRKNILNGIIYAAQSLNYTYNRMKYSKEEVKRFQKICTGITIENSCFDILSEKYDLPFISEPLKTDYRTKDTSEIVFITAKNRLLSCDIKGFHIFEHYKEDTRTVNDIYSKGWALIPVDQFEKQVKNIYIFPFLIADSEPISFYHNNDICECESPDCDCLKKYSISELDKDAANLESSVDIIMSFGDGKSIKSKVYNINKAFINTKFFIDKIDAISSFNDKVKVKNIYISANNKLFFIDKKKWMTGNYGFKNAKIFLAGWAIIDDIKDWKKIDSGRILFPYDKTRNNNYGVECRKLRHMIELNDYLKKM